MEYEEVKENLKMEYEEVRENLKKVIDNANSIIDNAILLLLKNKDEESIKNISSKKKCISIIQRNNKPEYLDFIESIFD